MGVKVTAAQAAALVSRHERIVRGHVKRGDLPAIKEGSSWRIDVDDLAHVPGWRVDPVRLADVQARDARTASSLAVRVEQLEKQLADAMRRIRALELRTVSPYAPVARLEGAGVGSDFASPVARVEPSRPPVGPLGATRTSGERGIPLVTFAKSHGVSPGTAANQRGAGAIHVVSVADPTRSDSHEKHLVTPDLRRGNLEEWHARSQLTKECADPTCPCHDILAERVERELAEQGDG